MNSKETYKIYYKPYYPKLLINANFNYSFVKRVYSFTLVLVFNNSKLKTNEALSEKGFWTLIILLLIVPHYSCQYTTLYRHLLKGGKSW